MPIWSPGLRRACSHSLLWEHPPPPWKDHGPDSSKPSDDPCRMRGRWNRPELHLQPDAGLSQLARTPVECTWRRATQQNPARFSWATADPKPWSASKTRGWFKLLGFGAVCYLASLCCFIAFERGHQQCMPNYATERNISAVVEASSSMDMVWCMGKQIEQILQSFNPIYVSKMNNSFKLTASFIF